MINSVSSVSFRGEQLNAHQGLIEQPGKFSKADNAAASQPAQQNVFPQTEPEKTNKHTALKVIGGIIGAVVVVGAGLWGLSKGVKVNPDTTNIFRKGVNKLVEAGEWIGKTVGGLFGKKAEKVADDAAGILA